MALSRSQRLTLIREITERLGDTYFYITDATLKQFGFPLQERWGGDGREYIMAMIADGSDADLIELADHLGYALHGFDAVAEPSEHGDARVECDAWGPGLRIFLGHLAVERVYASDLQAALAKYGVSCFVAHKDIKPTREWHNVIEAALASCDGLLALLHTGFHKSEWTDQEIGIVMGRDRPAFAVMLGEEPYGFIKRFQAFDGGKNVELLADDIAQALHEDPHMAAAMSEGLICAFEQSRSFNEALERVRHLEAMLVWDPAYAPRLRQAVKDNGKIANAFHGWVEALIKKQSVRAAE